MPETPTGYVEIMLGGQPYKFHLTIGAQKEIRRRYDGKDIVALVREMIASQNVDEDVIAAVLYVGCNRWGKDGQIGETIITLDEIYEHAGLDVLLTAAESITRAFAQAFGIDVDALKNVVCEAVEELVKSCGTTSPAIDSPLISD